MLIQRTIFAVLGTVLYLCAVAFGDDDLVELDGTIGQTVIFEMSTPTGVTKCMVTQNTEPEFALVPLDRFERPTGIDQRFTDETAGNCAMRILSPTSDHGGQWTIRAFTESNGVEVITSRSYLLRLGDPDPESEEDQQDQAEPEDDIVLLNGTIGHEVIFEMSTPTGVTKCMVTPSTGPKFTLVPDSAERPSEISQGFMDEYSRTCGMRILSPTTDHAGHWTIEAFTESNGAEVVTIRSFLLELTIPEGNVAPQILQTQRVDVFPSRTIRVYPGHSMTLRMLNHYNDLTSCIATSPDGQEFDVLNMVDKISNDVRPFDQCGVTVRVDTSHTGTWRLEATIGNDEIEKLHYFGDFYVLVQDSSAIHTEHTVTHVQRGAPASFRVGPSDAISCQLKNPRGQILPIEAGSCNVEIPIVTNVHEGFWTARYSLNGKVNVVEQATEVLLYDDHSLNATVTTTDNGAVNLLCSVRAYSFSFCQFIGPNHQVLNIFEGIGNDRYLYYGNGTQSTSMLTQRIHECGITILKPDHNDFGAWRCILGTGSGSTGSMLAVTAPGQTGHKDIAAYDLEGTVYVVRGNSFTVKCNANAVLKYCWVGSPNGTAYSVSSIDVSPTTLQYEGMGLPLGECGAVIPAAEDTDEGEWNCGMGVSNGQEVRVPIRVIVTDTLLIPEARNVTVRNNQAELSCFTIPGHDESIDYCRWIKPNGFGIERWASSDHEELHYTAYNTHSSCHLTIGIIERPSDIGVWTCVAGLAGSSVEVSARIQVSDERPFYSNSTFRSWCFGIGLAMITAIIAFVLIGMVHAKFRFKNRKDLPPQYEESQMRMPPPNLRP